MILFFNLSKKGNTTYLIVCVFIIIQFCFFYSCSSVDYQPKKIPPIVVKDLPLCPFQCIDSFPVDINLNVPKIIGQKENLLLIIDELSRSKLIVYDVNTKSIRANIPITGEGPNSAGNFAYSMGFFDVNTIIVSGSNGYFFYSLTRDSFLLQKKIIERLAQSWGGQNYKLFFINDNGTPILISNRNPPFDISLFYTANKEEEKNLTSMLKFLTIFNLETKTKEISVPIEEDNSILLMNRAYPTIDEFWDYNYSRKEIYSLIFPDMKVNTYKIRNSKAYLVKNNTLNLDPKYFREDYVLGFGQEIKDPMKGLLVNSRFLDILAQKNILMYTYLLGMPSDVYESTNNQVEITKIRNTKYYPPVHVVYSRNKIICNECVLKPIFGDNITFLDQDAFGYSIANNESKSNKNGLTIYKFKI